MEVLLLASSSKDNTRVKLEKGRDGFLWLLGLRIGKPYSYLLTLGTGLCLVCQAIPASNSTSYSDVGDFEGWTGLSPLAACPSTVEYEANEGSL
jgi:hypothetical protein